MSEIRNLEPRIVWELFDDITGVPRPSKKEGKIIDFLIEFARKHDLEHKKDAAGNVLIRKPATASMEGRPTVILQSHMDMVCEKNSDVTFNFDTDPIRTRAEDGWVMAGGTTLGADDGIGMAAALAVLSAGNIEHGPVEALFTVDEETGLTGAFDLGKEMLTGKYLINLDSEDEGEVFIGCAGGIDTVASFTYTRTETPRNYVFFRVDINGLLGGHSGDDIDKGRGNSNKLLMRLLRDAHEQLEMMLGYFDGGNLRNAIPREACAIFGIPPRNIPALFEMYGKFSAEIREELSATEPKLSTSISEMPFIETVMDRPAQQNLIFSVTGVPNGVLAMSFDMPGLVETSSNLASIKYDDKNTVTVTSSQRSSAESAKRYAAASVESVYRLAGARVEHSEGYPGWKPDPSSQLLAVTRESYLALFDREPVVRAIHAGLECGLFLQKYPDLEMVSFGPTLRGVHSPDERLEISTVDKFWKLLLEVLRRL